MAPLTSNQTVVFRKFPTGYAVAGEHLNSETRELSPELQEGEILTRNLFLSIDPGKDSPYCSSLTLFSRVEIANRRFRFILLFM